MSRRNFQRDNRKCMDVGKEQRYPRTISQKVIPRGGRYGTSFNDAVILYRSHVRSYLQVLVGSDCRDSKNAHPFGRSYVRCKVPRRGFLRRLRGRRRGRKRESATKRNLSVCCGRARDRSFRCTRRTGSMNGANCILW